MAFTEEQKAEALVVLLEAGGNYRATVKALRERWGSAPGVATLFRWSQAMEALPALSSSVPSETERNTEQTEQKKEGLAMVWYKVAERVGELLSDEDRLKQMHPDKLALAGAIATDKYLDLTEGRSKGGSAEAHATAQAAIINVQTTLPAPPPIAPIDAPREITDGG